MTTARKRTMKNTAEGAMDTMRSVAMVLQPTQFLTSSEAEHFDRIVQSREVSTWMPHDLSVATQLAVTMRRFGELQAQLDDEGLTLVNDRGTTVAHPLLSASMTMSNTIQALTRTLGLGASQRGMAGGPQKARNSADKTARELLANLSKHDLLA